MTSTRMTKAELIEQNVDLMARLAKLEAALGTQPKAEKAENAFVAKRKAAIAKADAHNGKAVVLDPAKPVPALKDLQKALPKAKTGCGQLEIPTRNVYEKGLTLRVNRCEKADCKHVGIEDADRYKSLVLRHKKYTGK